VAQLKDSIAQLESEKKTLDSSLREALKEKENQLTNLQRQIEDATQNATQRQSELQAQVTALRSQNSDLDKQVRDQKAATDAEVRKYRDDELGWEDALQSMGEKLKFTKEPTTPDGEILAVSKEVPLGWINIGTKNRVGRGMRFHIVSGRAGATARKAMAEVTNVEADRAEVRFLRHRRSLRPGGAR
jgi:exonuclease VII large subunit